VREREREGGGRGEEREGEGKPLNALSNSHSANFTCRSYKKDAFIFHVHARKPTIRDFHYANPCQGEVLSLPQIAVGTCLREMSNVPTLKVADLAI